MTLFPALTGALVVTDKRGEGIVLRGGGRVVRLRGRDASGRWLAAPCDAFGADDLGAALVLVDVPQWVAAMDARTK